MQELLAVIHLHQEVAGRHLTDRVTHSFRHSHNARLVGSAQPRAWACVAMLLLRRHMATQILSVRTKQNTTKACDNCAGTKATG